MSNVFVVGGTMKPGEPTYIERKADAQLYESVIAGNYCSVLTTRQMGKSSLMARTAARLREQSIVCATADLQGKGDPTTSREQWYYGFLKQVTDGLGLSFDLAGWWKQQELLMPAQRLTDFFADIALKWTAGRVVVFVDEVDWMIRLPFSDEFFAAIRSCFNRRATDLAFERLTFVLLGSASPSQLIKDATRTPFNIGSGIELTDFTWDEAKPLARWLGNDGETALTRVLYWTDGHPYLTQMLCEKVLEEDRQGKSAGVLVDSVVRDRLLSNSARHEENNLKFVADRLTQGTGNLRLVLRTYRDVLRGSPVKDLPASPVHTSLRLSGVVKPDAERYLRIRNRAYQTVFNEDWVRAKMPSDRAWIVATTAAATLIVILAAWYLLMFPNAYVQALESASNDTEVAYQSYDQLRTPFYASRANDLLAQFFERREDRDSAILVVARGGDRGRLVALIGTDYPSLQKTFRHEELVSSVAFSPDGKLVATGSQDKTARVFEAASGREVSRLVHEGSVHVVAFSPDSRLVATGSEDKTARVFEASLGREVSRLNHEGSVHAVAFSPDGRLVATGSDDKTARVFEVATGNEVSHLVHEGSVHAVAFSPNGKLVATGSEDIIARVFELATGHEVSRLVHQDAVNAVAFSPDGKLVATGSWDSTARVFVAATGREVSRLVHEGPVHVVVFSPNGRLVATGSEDDTARVLEVTTGNEMSRLAHQGSVRTVAFSPDSTLVATGSEDKTARVFDATPGREVSRLFHQDAISAVAFSPDGKLVATGLWDNAARVFVAATGREVSHVAHQGPVFGVAFSPDSKLVATGSWDSTARVFVAATGREVSRLTHEGPVHVVAFSPDGKLLATGSSDSTARVFEVATGHEMSRLVQQGPVNAVAFSPDGKLLATGSFDKTACVFEVATGHEMSCFVHQGPVNAVAFSPDGKQFIAQTHNWLHLYERYRNQWRPKANRYLPVLWPGSLRPSFQRTDFPKYVEVIRDANENLLELDRISFDDYAEQPTKVNPPQLVSEWSEKLGLKFDSRGRIAPIEKLGLRFDSRGRIIPLGSSPAR